MEIYRIRWNNGHTLDMDFSTVEDAETYLRETCGAPDDLSGRELERQAGATIVEVEGEDDFWPLTEEEMDALADANCIGRTIADCIRDYQGSLLGAAQAISRRFGLPGDSARHLAWVHYGYERGMPYPCYTHAIPMI